MYKRLLFILIGLIFSGMIFWSCSDDGGSTNPPPTPSLKIVSPNGGEIVQMDSTVWVYFDNELADPVDIYVYKGQDSIGYVDVNIDLKDSVAWLVPNTWDEGFDYRLKIVSSTDPTKYDFSDANFTVAPAGNYIMVTSPNGGGIWLKGQTKTINWITNLSGTVNISLYKDGNPHYVIYNTQVNDGTQGWPVPNNGTLDDSDDYTILVQSIESPAVYDFSDAYFCLASDINTENVVGDWTVAFSKQPDQFYFYADGRVTADSSGTLIGEGTWEMTGNGIKVFDGETSTYLLGIVDGNDIEGHMLTEDGYLVDWDAVRVIPELYSPNGGQVWMRGTTQTITWNPAIAGNVVISLADSTGVVQNIATVSGDLGTYDWAIPTSVEPGAAYLIRIAKEINGEAMDESVSYICISEDLSPDITGEWYMKGTWSKWETIWQFNSDGTWTNDFAESGDWTLTGNGLKWTYNSGSPTFYYFGLVDGDKVDGTMGDPASGNSGTWFGHRILRVVTPNGGGFYQPAEVVPVTWYETITAENVTLDLYENDVLYRNLGTVNVNTTPSYNWTIPADLTTSTKYKIRMTSTTSDIYDESDDYFTVDAVAPSATLDENFEDGVADGWTGIDGIWTVADSVYTVASDSLGVSTTVFGTPMTGNYIMEAKLRKTVGSIYNFGIVMNGDSSSLTYEGDWNDCAMLLITTSGSYQFAVSVGGVWSGSGWTSSADIVTGLGSWNTLKVIVDNSNNNYHVFINGVYQTTVNNNSLTEGSIGLKMYDNMFAGLGEFDYVKVSPINKSAMQDIQIKRVDLKPITSVNE